MKHGVREEGHTEIPISSPKPSTPIFPLPQKSSKTTIIPPADFNGPCFSLVFQEETLHLLKKLLLKYGMDFTHLIPPFSTEAEQVDFVVMCLTLLNGHCALLVKRSSEYIPSPSLVSKIEELRVLFFQMLDMDIPELVQQAVSETLTAGASILLPSLRDKLRLSLEMLDDVNNLTRGQKLLCKVIFTSLEDHQQVASILALARPTKPKDMFGASALKWTEELLGRLLKILAEEVDRKIYLLESSEEDEGPNNYVSAFGQKLHNLLTSLQNHLFAHCLTLCMSTSETHIRQDLDDVLWQMLETHLSQLFTAVSSIYKKMEDLLEAKPEFAAKLLGGWKVTHNYLLG